MLKKAAILIPALIPALLATTLSGCGSSLRYYKNQGYLNTDLIEDTADATDALKDELTRKVPKGSLIVVSTLLNVKNLKETSSFGRLISDQIATELHNSGYQIIGMDLPIDLFMMTEAGELKLSDEDKTLLKRYNAIVLVGGVYAPGKQNTYVTLRAVNRFTKQVIASTDFSVPLGPDVKTLLKTKDSPPPAPLDSPGSVPESTLDDATTNGNDAAPALSNEPIKLEQAPAEIPSNPSPEAAPSAP